jgi:hypothetical protein
VGTALADRLPWPLPALLAWAAGWGVLALTLHLGGPEWLSMALGCALGVACSVLGHSWWRRGLIGVGFPLSLAVSGAVSLPAWAWLLPLALLLLIYPMNAWRDAPLFPTPAHALVELPQHAPLPEGAHVLDAGCGLGHGLLALREAYPQAELHGMEWSWPLRLWCGLRCPWARVVRGDIWATNWGTYDMVYLFQRPESMPRALDKARRELRPGAWLVSLEFEAISAQSDTSFRAPGGRMVWVYRAPFDARPLP